MTTPILGPGSVVPIAGSPKVVHITGAEPEQTRAPKKVIETLEDARAAAKRSEYVSISVVTLLPNGHSEHQWFIREGQWFTMLGAMEVAQTRIKNRLMGFGGAEQPIPPDDAA